MNNKQTGFKSSYDDRNMAPGGGPTINRDPSKRDVYKGPNMEIREQFRKMRDNPNSQMHDCNPSGPSKGGWKK